MRPKALVVSGAKTNWTRPNQDGCSDDDTCVSTTTILLFCRARFFPFSFTLYLVAYSSRRQLSCFPSIYSFYIIYDVCCCRCKYILPRFSDAGGRGVVTRNATLRVLLPNLKKLFERKQKGMPISSKSCALLQYIIGCFGNMSMPSFFDQTDSVTFIERPKR